MRKGRLPNMCVCVHVCVVAKERSQLELAKAKKWEFIIKMKGYLKDSKAIS